MSSIDKYVSVVAKNIDRSIAIRKYNGKICGYKGSVKVFEVADRYGYLSDDEKATIEAGIAQYQDNRQQDIIRRREEEALRKAQEAELERQRLLALDNLRGVVQAKLQELQHNSQQAGVAVENFTRGILSQCDLQALRGFDVQGLRNRIDALIASVQTNNGAQLSMAHMSAEREVQAINSNIRQNSSIATIQSLTAQVGGVSSMLGIGVLPVDEVDKLKNEIQIIAAGVVRLKNACDMIQKISSTLPGFGSKAQEILSNLSINSMQDIADAQQQLCQIEEQIKAKAYQLQDDMLSHEIAVLSGMLTDTTGYQQTHSSTYVMHSYEADISCAADQVYRGFEQLQCAEYSTCSSDRMAEVKGVVQGVLLKGDFSQSVLQELESYRDECSRYKTADAAIALDYGQYKKDRAELISLGDDEQDIPSFDVHNPSQSLDAVADRLVNFDLQKEKDAVEYSNDVVDLSMKTQGFVLIYSDRGEGGLSARSWYVRPGCEGVIYETEVTSNSVRRVIKGLERVDGRRTEIGRIMGVAQIDEKDGVARDFLSIYSAVEGIEQGEMRDVVDVDSPDAREHIERDSCCKLDTATEQAYENAVAMGTAEAVAKYAAVGAHQQAGEATQSYKPELDDSHNNKSRQKVKEIEQQRKVRPRG